jgi:hypothetical protein
MRLTKAATGGQMTAQWIAGTEEPLEGSTELGPVRGWHIGALRTGGAFAAGLRSAGLPDDEVTEAGAIREEFNVITREAARYRTPGVLYRESPVPLEVLKRQARK